MKYSLFDVTPEDVDKIQAKECYSVGELGCCKLLIKMAMVNVDSIALGFGDEDGRLHGIAGSYRQWEHSSQLWAIFDKRTEKYPLALTKVCESLIKFAVKKQDLHRVSLNVRSDYTCGNAFANFLKFSLEGRMNRYLPDGGDANLYARLFV
jgi:hypothetical protein